MADEHLPGLDPDRLTDWLRTAAPDVGTRLTAELLTGGKSNLTYRVADHERTWVVRRPPLGHVLATAHDMAREYRVIAALRDTAVPVPRTVALCTDDTVIGAPFYVMEHVVGTPYRNASELAALGPQRTHGISTRLVDTLAGLHGIDPVAVGLADFGRPAGFLARQVSRWKSQLDASHTRDLPLADELHRRLAEDVPEESAPGIVHGDYRLDNVLVDDTDKVAAVIDWEMATLGDPLTDLALLVLYQRLDDLLGRTSVTEASSAAGYLTEQEILARYAGHSSRDLSRFGFYLGLAAFKLAAITQGIHYRHLQGRTVGAGFEHVGERVVPLLEAGLTALKET